MTPAQSKAAVWTESVCGDGAVLLRDGAPMTISQVLDALNTAEHRAALRVPASTGEVERLRAALIDCCNAVGGYAGPLASTDFLLMVPSEVKAKVAALAALPPSSGWQPIETAPETTDDVLVGWWEGPTAWDEESQTLIRHGKQVWRQTISSAVDTEWRRGFRHRNGACQATYWCPLPPPPAMDAVELSSGCVFRDLKVPPPSKEGV